MIFDIPVSEIVKFVLLMGAIITVCVLTAIFVVNDLFGPSLNRCPACRMEPSYDDVNASYSSQTGYRFVPCEKHATKKEVE